jgi:dTDP-4-amino-4,6-dideoxygalactose transaminase
LGNLRPGLFPWASPCLAIDLGAGDEVIATPRTFIATASSTVLLSTKPMFIPLSQKSSK